MNARAALLAPGAALLAGSWALAHGLGTLSAHMVAHVTAVAVAAPLLALGAPGPRAERAPGVLGSPAFALAACGAELVVVWGWHLPALHEAARASLAVFALEQAMFLGAGYAVWAGALAPQGARSRPARLAGVGVLLATSMHMTLLGALLAIAPRPLYHHATLWDQQLGGVVMLAVGGLAYGAGGLWLLARLLAPDPGMAR